MRELTLLEMLKRGVHFGHRVSRWHPKMRPYIHTVRQGVHIINLEKTQEMAQRAYAFISTRVAGGATVLFVGTKRQAQTLTQETATRLGMPYVTHRWIGGMFTNFATIAKLTKKMKTLRAGRESGEFATKYTKKEQLEFDREITKLESLFGGVESLDKLPDIVFVEDVKQEKTAVREARKMKIPLVAIVDTNGNPDLIDYPIPANDDATKSLEFFIAFIAEAVEEGLKQRATNAQAAAAVPEPA